MSEKPDDPIEQMWEHLDAMSELLDSLRKTYGDRAAEPLRGLAVRMSDTLSDIQQGTDPEPS